MDTWIMAKTDFPKGFNRRSDSVFRWVPEPYRLRPDGWKAVTFKHPDGRYFTMGEAVDACAAINRLVDDWYDRGVRPTGRWAHLAPDNLAPAVKEAPDAIGKLIDEWMGARDPQTGKWSEGCKTFNRLGARTQADYRNRMGRLLETLAGHAAPPHRKALPADVMAAEQARYARDIAATRAESIRALLPIDGEETPPLQQAYEDLLAAGDTLGLKMTHGAKSVITITHAWLEWVVKVKRKLPYNPAGSVQCATPQGRVVIWPDNHYQAVLDAANAMGWRSIAFAMRLSREMSWAQGDVLALTLAQVHDGVRYDTAEPRRVVRIEGARLKTGNRTFTTLTQEGVDLLDEILNWRRETAGEGVALLPNQPLLIVDRIDGSKFAAGKAWGMDYFRHRFAEVRARAAEKIGEPISERFADLRDTAITEMNEAGLSKHHKQSRNQHSLESIDALDQKHYGLTTHAISDEAADLIDRHRARKAAYADRRPGEVSTKRRQK